MFVSETIGCCVTIDYQDRRENGRSMNLLGKFVLGFLSAVRAIRISPIFVAFLIESWVLWLATCSGVDVIPCRRLDPTACLSGHHGGPSTLQARSGQGPVGPVADRLTLDSPDPRGSPVGSAGQRIAGSADLSVRRRRSYPRLCQESLKNTNR